MTSAEFERRFSLPPGVRWAYAIVLDPDGADARRAACDGAFGTQTTLRRNDPSVRALTSAIYVGE